MGKLTFVTARLQPGNYNLTKNVDYDYLITDTQSSEHALIQFGSSLAPFEALFSTAASLMILSGILNEVMNILIEGSLSESASNSFMFGILPAQNSTSNKIIPGSELIKISKGFVAMIIILALFSIIKRFKPQSGLKF